MTDPQQRPPGQPIHPQGLEIGGSPGLNGNGFQPAFRGPIETQPRERGGFFWSWIATGVIVVVLGLIVVTLSLGR